MAADVPSTAAREVAHAIAELIQRTAIEHGNLAREAREVLAEKLDALIAEVHPKRRRRVKTEEVP